MTPRLRPCTPAELQRVLQKLGLVLDRSIERLTCVAASPVG
jgi:hypothetical protein